MLLVRGLKGEMSFGFSKEEERILDKLEKQSKLKDFDNQSEEFKTVVLMGNSIFMVATHEHNMIPIPSFKPYALISLYIYNGMYDRAKRTAMLMRQSIAFHPDPTWRLQYKKGRIKEFDRLVARVVNDVKSGIEKYGKEEYFRNHYMES